MIILSSLITDAVTVLLTALTDENNQVLPENMPTERGYDKYIFRLEKKENEQDLEVVVSTTFTTVVDDCNRRSPAVSALVKTSNGYYLIDRPTMASTLMACQTFHTETMAVYLQSNILPYNSETPIVIHAIKGVYVSYKVQEKSAEPTLDL